MFLLRARGVGNYGTRGGLGEKISDLHSLRVIRGLGLWLLCQVSSLRAQAWIALHWSVYSHLVQISWQ